MPPVHSRPFNPHKQEPAMDDNVFEYITRIDQMTHDGPQFLIADGSTPTAQEIRDAKKVGGKIYSLRAEAMGDALATCVEEIEERLARKDPAFARTLHKEFSKVAAKVAAMQAEAAAKGRESAEECRAQIDRAHKDAKEFLTKTFPSFMRKGPSGDQSAKGNSETLHEEHSRVAATFAAKKAAAAAAAAAAEEERPRNPSYQELAMGDNVPGHFAEMYPKLAANAKKEGPSVSESFEDIGFTDELFCAMVHVGATTKETVLEFLEGKVYDKNLVDKLTAAEAVYEKNKARLAPDQKTSSTNEMREDEAELRNAIYKGLKRGFLIPKEKAPSTLNPAPSKMVDPLKESRPSTFESGDNPEMAKTCTGPVKGEMEDGEEWHDEETNGSFNPADPKCKCAIS